MKKKKFFFLLFSLWVLTSFIGMLFFLYIILFGIPEITPYPANPFFLLTFFIFSFYFGWKKLCREGYSFGLKKRELMWLLLAGVNVVIWYQYFIAMKATPFSLLYRWILGFNIFCWAIYIFLPLQKRCWLNIVIVYFFLAAVIYYSKHPF